jgi:hypothetical protein
VIQTLGQFDELARHTLHSYSSAVHARANADDLEAAHAQAPGASSTELSTEAGARQLPKCRGSVKAGNTASEP